MKIVKEEYNYKGIKAIKYSNGTIDIIIPKEFGPRILYCGLTEHKKNIFSEPDVEFKTKYGTWKIYGGHRLWTAPEDLQTYFPDNEAVEIKEKEGYLRISKNFKQIGIKKEVSIKFISSNKLEVIHRIHNTSSNKKRLSLWSLSVMCKNGVAILPQNKENSDKFGFLPNKNLVLWKYTDIRDTRLKIEDDFIYIKQTPNIKKPLKIGQYLTSGWIAYETKDFLFKKIFKIPEPYPYTLYPDFQSNVEIYCCDRFLELELLTPILEIKKNNFIEQKEEWELTKK